MLIHIFTYLTKCIQNIFYSIFMSYNALIKMYIFYEVLESFYMYIYKGEISSNLFQSKMNWQIKKALKLRYSKCETRISDEMFNRILLININLSSFHPQMLKFSLEKWMIKLIMKQLIWMKIFLESMITFWFLLFAWF